MTSRLRRKRRITPPNTCPEKATSRLTPTRGKLLVACCALAVGLAVERIGGEMARADGVASLSSAGSKLNWRARGVLEPPAENPQPAIPAKAVKASQAQPASRVRQGVMQVADDEPIVWQNPPSRSRLDDDFDDLRLPPVRDNNDPFRDETRQPRSLDPFPSDPTPMPRRSDLPPSPGLGAADAEEGCGPAEKACRELIAELRARDITTIYPGIGVEGEGGVKPVEGRDVPCECKMPKETYIARAFSPTTMTWKASATCHKPLYFEDVQLERYGHSWNPVVQPFMSAAHFFVSVPLLPYNMGVEPPGECIYTLGYYRPGNCAPYMLEPFPLSVRGAVFEAIGAAGFAFWFWPPQG